MKAVILALGLLAAASASAQAATVELGRYSFTATLVNSIFYVEEDGSGCCTAYQVDGPFEMRSDYSGPLPHTPGTTGEARLILNYDAEEGEVFLKCSFLPCRGRIRDWIPIRPVTSGDRFEISNVGAYILYDFAAMRLTIVTDNLGDVRGPGTDWMFYHGTKTEWVLTDLRVRDLTVPLPLPGTVGPMALACGILALLRRRRR